MPAPLLPDGYRDKAKLNPENLFVATIASAHMLSWLHVAFQMEIEVESGCRQRRAERVIRGRALGQRSDPEPDDHVHGEPAGHAKRTGSDSRTGARAMLHRELDQDEGDGSQSLTAVSSIAASATTALWSKLSRA